MGCYHPMKGYMRQDASGRRFTMSSPRSGADYMPQTVPCGQCVGCRLDRSRSWAIRCMHEASLYSRNCFITLTYSDEFLPVRRSLDYSHFQKFMKRLRKRFSGVDVVTCDDSTDRPIRFYMAGEYGEKLGRPHFHACIFNFDFDDKKPFMKSPAGKMIYRSASLEELWPYGFSSIGEVTFQSAAYVARYIMKKITGSSSEVHYEWVDPVTGEVFLRTPEFNKMSLKPGIGGRWFDQFSGDVFPHDYVIVDGKPSKPPRYYDKLFRVENPYGWDEVEFERYVSSQKRVLDNTTDRLQVKEVIATRRLSMLKRTLL